MLTRFHLPNSFMCLSFGQGLVGQVNIFSSMFVKPISLTNMHRLTASSSSLDHGVGPDLQVGVFIASVIRLARQDVVLDLHPSPTLQIALKTLS